VATVAGDESSRVDDDALSALVNLGYRAQEAKDIIKRITQSQAGPMPLKDLIRETLKELARG
jgi:Holliday junction DNA helicase RuvA